MGIMVSKLVLTPTSIHYTLRACKIPKNLFLLLLVLAGQRIHQTRFSRRSVAVSATIFHKCEVRISRRFLCHKGGVKFPITLKRNVSRETFLLIFISIFLMFHVKHFAFRHFYNNGSFAGIPALRGYFFEVFFTFFI